MKELLLLALVGGVGYFAYDSYSKSKDAGPSGRAELPPPAKAGEPNVTIAFDPKWGEVDMPVGIPKDIIMPAGNGFWGALAERFQTSGPCTDCEEKHE